MIKKYFCRLFGFFLKNSSIKIFIPIMTELSIMKKFKISSLVAFYRTLYELKKVPKASEPNIANIQIEFTKKISFLPNQILANFGAPLIMKQNPREQKNVPIQKK